LYNNNRNAFNEPQESREKIIAAEKRERKELIMEQFALRRSTSKEDEVSLSKFFKYYYFSIFLFVPVGEAAEH